METTTYIHNITSFSSLYQNSWQGALQTLDTIKENNKEEELLEYINDIIDIYDGSIEDIKLNDLLWFDRDNIFKALNIDCE